MSHLNGLSFETILASGPQRQALFTQPLRRGILGRSDAGSCITPVLTEVLRAHRHMAKCRMHHQMSWCLTKMRQNEFPARGGLGSSPCPLLHASAGLTRKGGCDRRASVGVGYGRGDMPKAALSLASKPPWPFDGGEVRGPVPDRGQHRRHHERHGQQRRRFLPHYHSRPPWAGGAARSGTPRRATPPRQRALGTGRISARWAVSGGELRFV